MKPVSGTIVSPFNSKTGKLNVTYQAAKDEPTRAPMEGTVIATGKFADNSEYLVVQSENQIVYILSNITQISKKIGTFVTAGEQLAVAAKQNSSNAYSCNLEVWYKGQSINPTKFIKHE